MGWKGTMRSMAAASRAAAREAERRRKAAEKQQSLDNAYDAVANWEYFISRLITVHVDLADSIDWHSIASTSKPLEPKLDNKHELSAIEKFQNFKPNIFHKIFGTAVKKQESLKSEIPKAAQRDRSEFESSKEEYIHHVSEWDSETGLAKRLIANDPEAKKEVLSELQSLVDEDRIGDEISFSINAECIHATASVHDSTIVPKVRRKLRASGTLSETKMPVGESNELYQDYVASVALKVAGDIFHVIPDNTVFVTCTTSMLNSKTGHIEQTPILSVQFMRETFLRLNLENVDPSDSMSNFIHKMNFKRTKGFASIEPLMP